MLELLKGAVPQKAMLKIIFYLHHVPIRCMLDISSWRHGASALSYDFFNIKIVLIPIINRSKSNLNLVSKSQHIPDHTAASLNQT